MNAEPVAALPEHDAADPAAIRWGYEAKIDGHRLQVWKHGNDIRILTRRGLKPQVDVTRVATQARGIKANQVIIDGEGAALDKSGRTSWAALERRGVPVTLFAFDLLYLDAKSLLSRPLRERQTRLADIIEGTGLQLCVALPGTLAEISESIRRLGLEGIVAKNPESPYRPDRRSFDWQKKAFTVRQEFVIGGYRADGNDRVDALLIGVYENSQLMFASKIRSGLDKTNRTTIRKALQPLNTKRCPFANLPTSAKRSASAWNAGGVAADEMAEMQWVRLELLAEVEFRHWTEGGLLRHPVFVRLRSDKPARDVVRET